MGGMHSSLVYHHKRSEHNFIYSFTAIPDWGESDVRMMYCAFVISHLLGDWSGIDVEKAIDFITKCRVRAHSNSNLSQN
jgi:prenyltransferase beta subunit